MSGSTPTYRPLLVAMSRDLWLLCSQTLTLARLEIVTSARSMALHVAVAALGMVVAIGGVLVLLSALVLIAIALGLPPWAAASVVGALLVGVGAATAYLSVIGLLDGGLAAPHTRRSIKDTVEWLQSQTR